MILVEICGLLRNLLNIKIDLIENVEKLQQQDSVGRGTNNPAIIATVKQHFRLQTTLLTTILAIFGPLQNYEEIYVLILK